jgi:hypothetical protein
VAQLVANLVALGDGWSGTAPPIRLVGWTLTLIVVFAFLAAARATGVFPGLPIQDLQFLVTHLACVEEQRFTSFFALHPKLW